MPDLGPFVAIPGMQHSVTGAIHRAVKAADNDAAVVANSRSVESRDTINALIDARQQLLFTSAAAKLIKASDAMLESLLGIRA